MLLSCVRDAPDTTAGLLDDLPRRQLDHLVQAARFHGVTGYLARAVDGSTVASTSYAELVREASADAVTGHLRALGDLTRVQPLLDETGARWLVVKGPVLTEVLHGDPTLRSYVDLDVLVRAADFAGVVTHLESHGVELLDRNWPLIREHVAGELHFALPLGTPLDLHWQLVFHEQTRAPFAIDIGAMLERAREVDLGSLRVTTTDAADTVVHLAVHAATAGGHRLIWLKDLELALGAADVATVVERANAWRVGPVVGVMLARVRDVLGASVPDDALEALVPSATWRGLLRAVDAGWPAQRVTARGSPAKLIARAARGDVRRSASATLRQATRLRAWNLRQPRRSTSSDVFAEVPYDASARADYFAAVAREAPKR